MPTFNIVVFGGDYCGPEVTAEALKASGLSPKSNKTMLTQWDRSCESYKKKDQKSNSISMNSFSAEYVCPNYKDLNAALMILQASIDATGSPLTDEALDAAKKADAVLLGAIGGPKYGTGPVRPEQGLLSLRKSLQTFGNLRPCNFASDSLVSISPLKENICRGVNFTIIRELTGGIYFGERKEATEEDGYAWDTEPYSKAEIKRITHLAAHLAMSTDPPQKVWSLDKANVLATSRLWRKVVNEVMKKDYPQLDLGHHLIDSAAMLMVKDPRALNGVIVTSNLFGDIISDEASVIPGSLGLLPSASLNGVPDGKQSVSGIYEPIHGSAPDIAGQEKVNPVAMILSTAMMLQYSFNLPKEAKAIEDAVRKTIDDGVRTGDIGGKSTTKQVGDHVAQTLSKILSG